MSAPVKYSEDQAQEAITFQTQTPLAHHSLLCNVLICAALFQLLGSRKSQIALFSYH